MRYLQSHHEIGGEANKERVVAMCRAMLPNSRTEKKPGTDPMPGSPGQSTGSSPGSESTEAKPFCVMERSNARIEVA